MFKLESFPTPTNLNEALDCLDLFLLDYEKLEIKTKPIDDVILLHSSLGRYLRNTWDLWHAGPLNKYFNDIGINHPDDISNFILENYWCKLNSCEFDSESAIKRIKEFYKT